MKSEEIEALLNTFERAVYRSDDGELESWSGRELQQILGYTKWENFYKVIEKAVQSCLEAGINPQFHFISGYREIKLPRGGERTMTEYALTRYACYLIAQNGDPSKPQIAFAQTYFAMQTRKLELIEARLKEKARLHQRLKLTKAEKRLSKLAINHGVKANEMGKLHSRGDAALFGGPDTQAMKQQLGVPPHRPLADFLPTMLIVAKEMSAEMTSYKVEDQNLYGLEQVATEHESNNTAVRQMLLARGIKPEFLPAADDVQEVKKRLSNEQKQLSKNAHKRPPQKPLDGFSSPDA
jgi:DNA-damage-inducible protein D